MAWTQRNTLLLVYVFGLSLLCFGVLMALGFYPLDATHTRWSTLRCYHEVPGYDCKANDLAWKKPLPAISVHYEERNSSYTVCGCYGPIVEKSCPGGQATWMANVRPDDTPTADSCSTAPLGLWVYGVVLSSCAALVLVACTASMWHDDHRDALMRVRLLDPNIPTGDPNV